MNNNPTTGKMQHYILPSSIIEKIINPEVERVLNNIRNCSSSNQINFRDNQLFTTVLNVLMKNNQIEQHEISEIGSKNWNLIDIKLKEYWIEEVISYLESMKDTYQYSIFIDSSVNNLTVEIITEINPNTQKYNSKYI